MPEYKGFEYLKRKNEQKTARIDLRYRYYEMKNHVREYREIVPEGFDWLSECLGWCGKAVDSIADRLAFHEFADDYFDINTIYQMNNPDILFDSAILSALVCSCSYIYISPDEEGFPRLRVIDGRNGYGIIDPITGMLTEGYAVLERDDNDKPTLEAYLIKGMTYYYENGKPVSSYSNKAPYPLLVPIINRPDAKREFGHSRISRACMKLMQGALRTLKRSEISAEFYSFPQKYVLGMDYDADEFGDQGDEDEGNDEGSGNKNAETFNKWKATMSSFLRIDANENGSNPTVGQFTQQSMEPYVSQIRMFASLFAGETGLTLDDLGFVSDNPSSSEAIKASHENLRLVARKAQKTFGTGFLNAGYLAACIRDGYPYQRRQIYLTKPKWEPIFEPDASTLSLIGDGAIKINQAVPGYFGRENLREYTGIEGEDGGYSAGTAGEDRAGVQRDNQ